MFINPVKLYHKNCTYAMIFVHNVTNIFKISSDDRFASEIETSTPIVYTHTYNYISESGIEYTMKKKSAII